MRYLYIQVIFFVSFVAQEITDPHVISLQLVDKLRPLGKIKVQVKVQNGRKHQKERQKNMACDSNTYIYLSVHNCDKDL